MSNDEPRDLLRVALESGEAGLELLACLADMENAPPDVRVAAIRELGRPRSTRGDGRDAPFYTKTFLRALGAREGSVQAAAIEVFGALDFAAIPHAAIAAALPAFAPEGRAAAFALFRRVHEEAKKLDYATRTLLLDALAQQRRDEGDKYRGALAFAPLSERSGALSVPEDDRRGWLSKKKSD